MDFKEFLFVIVITCLAIYFLWMVLRPLFGTSEGFAQSREAAARNDKIIADARATLESLNNTFPRH